MSRRAAGKTAHFGGGIVSSDSGERGGIRQWMFFVLLAGFVVFWVFILWRVITGAHGI